MIPRLLLLVLPLSLWCGQSFGQDFLLKADNLKFRIVPKDLSVFVSTPDSSEEMEVSSPALGFEPIAELNSDNRQISWSVPGRELRVSFTLEGNRLLARFQSKREQTIDWPISAGDPQATSIVFPATEGLFIPSHDPLWLERLSEEECFSTHGDLSMPFWGYAIKGHHLTYILKTDLQNDVCLRNVKNQVRAVAKHTFRERDGFPAYEVLISVVGPSPIDPALEFRKWLIQEKRHISFSSKIDANPEVKKLFGASHIYVYGTGRTADALIQLRNLGYSKLWIGYDQDPRRDKYLAGKDFIKMARSLGYLVGPYDTYDNIQDPKTSDTCFSIFDEDLFKKGSILRKDGNRLQGFAGRGFELSSAALKKTSYFHERVASLSTGVNSYFLDCDASGSLFDDYDQDHPMTPAIDRKNKIERLRFISETSKMVLGSERAASWSTPYLHFTHGIHTIDIRPLYSIIGDANIFGGWSPYQRPAIFFKQMNTPEGLREIHFNPTYRLPLYQAVFHDSVVATDRWEFSPVKLKDCVVNRTLLQLLYNVPPLWSLDLEEIRQNARLLARHNAFFSPLHQAIGDKPLTEFSFLSADRLVQRTTFGGNDRVSVTANFGKSNWQDIQAGCVKVDYARSRNQENYCP